MSRRIAAFLLLAIPALAADLIVVGSGVAGMATAIEAASHGAEVVVIEMSSVFGGHAVMSEGGLSLINTETQRRLGITDSHAIARADFIRWGENPNIPWVDRYVRESSPEIHDWLVSMGLRFTGMRRSAGNSVPRFHENAERGLGVAKVLFLQCLKSPMIRFEWNTQAVGLAREGDGVTGVECLNLRTGKKSTLRASGVVLATGGYQSNIDFLRKHWPSAKTFPERMLAGSGVNSKGSGHLIASAAGGALVDLDRQWNYPWGLPDPRYADGERGISVRMPLAIWVNKDGQRFVDEHAGPKTATPAVLAQPGSTYWAIFDAPGKESFIVAGTDWTDDRRVRSVLLNNPEVVKSADSLAALARSIGVPAANLAKTVERFNQLVSLGADEDFGRFGKGNELGQGSHRRPPARIATPPFHAMQLYPLARKSMGGIATDHLSRVLTAKGAVIPGLFAVGEAAGLGGLNGIAALEGTFLAPGILQGRIVGRQFVREPRSGSQAVTAAAHGKPERKPDSGKAIPCQTCHNVKDLVAQARPGYWHFDRVHSRVMERNYECLKCHAEMTPFRPSAHKIDRGYQAQQCANCHLASE